MTLFSRAVTAVTAAAPVERLITGSRAGRALASRFVAGDDLASGAEVATGLATEGLKVSLDLLGEEVHDVEGANRAVEGYLQVLDVIGSNRLDANISVKLTQLGLAIREEMARSAIDRLAERAAEVGTTVTIDMEDSRYTEATVDIYADAQSRHGNLGVCLQAYLFRTPSDLERLEGLGGHIRLCKGAYREPPTVAFQSRHEVDAAFRRLLMVLMRSPSTRPAIATHDPEMIRLALALAEERDAGFEFQMLYGVRPAEQRRLAAAGHDVRVYVPFGSSWYPYLTRRLAERPSNLGFFLRALGSFAERT